MKTTFKKIRDYGPCKSGWGKLLEYHKPKSFDEEVSIRQIIESNGVGDAVWALRAVEDQESVMLFCADVAESVLHIYEEAYHSDKRVRECIRATRLFAKGEISKEDLKAKREAVDTAAAEADVAADAAYAADAADAAAAYDAAAAAAFAAKAAAYAAATAAKAAAYAAAYAAATADVADVAAATAEKKKEIEKLLLKYC